MPNFARLDLSFSSAIEPVFFLVPTANYNLLAQPARLVIRSKAGIELFNQTDAAAGITIIDHVLTDDLEYPDGSVIPAGETVKAWRVAPDLSGVPMADPLNTKMQQNWHGFTADPGGAEWVTEGFWDVWPDTGPVPHCNQNGLTGVQVGGSVAVAVFFPGAQGVPGADGEGIGDHILDYDHDLINTALQPGDAIAASVIVQTTAYRFVTDVEKNIWNSKQDALTFDLTPTSGSTNPVQSNGIFNAFGVVNINLSNHEGDTSTHGVTEIIGAAEEQTLTNKTIDDYTNKVCADTVHFRAKATEDILKGQPIRVSGYNAGEDAQEIELANNQVSPSNGLARYDILQGDFGHVLHAGQLNNIDTSMWNELDILFVDGLGVLVNVQPETGWKQPIAFVLRKHASLGALQVTTDYPKQDANDVRITAGVGNPTMNTVQQYLTSVGSAGFFDGFEVSDAGGGNGAVAAGFGMIRDSANSTAELKSFVSAGTLGIAIPTDTVQYVFCNNAGVISISPDEFIEAENLILVGWFVNEGGSIVHADNLGVRLDESIGQAGRCIRRVHSIVRDKRRGGLFFGDSGTRNITISPGVLWWGRSEYPIVAKDTSGADTLDLYWSAGSVAGLSQWPNTQYDNAGILTNLGVSKWGVMWFYLETDGDIICVYGTDTYNTAAAADQQGEPLSSLPERVKASGVLAARIVFQSGDNTGTWESAFETLFSGVAITDHSELSSIGTLTHDEIETQLVANTAARHDALTIAGQNYLSLIGQQLTADPIDLTSHVTGVLPSGNLPSYVDSVLEFADLASFPASGETGKIYVAIDTSLTYRWSGTVYVELKDQTAIWGQVSGVLTNQSDLSTALDEKEPVLSPGLSTDFFRGDKTFQVLNTAAVPEDTNLYYTESRVNANTTVAANSAHILLTNDPHNTLTPSFGAIVLGINNGADTIFRGVKANSWTDLTSSIWFQVGEPSGYSVFSSSGGTALNRFFVRSKSTQFYEGSSSTIAVPSTSALVSIDSTTKGFLPPRMTTTQRDAIGAPVSGLIIYNTTTNALNFYNGSVWSAV